MMSKKMVKELNKQINEELYSSYIYLSMAAYFEDLGLSGFAQWLKAQTQEEIAHAMIFYNHIAERGERIELQKIDKPQTTWKSPVDVFKAALKHEEHISARINTLVDLAIKESDHATNNFLQWFVSEQVEEEESVGEVINNLSLIGKDKTALFMLDRELGARTFTPPAPLQKGGN
ncbi:MAG: ferritin [Candidatus Muiribacteriota bacterium]